MFFESFNYFSILYSNHLKSVVISNLGLLIIESKFRRKKKSHKFQRTAISFSGVDM